MLGSSSVDVPVQRVFSRRQLIPLHSTTLWRIERGVVCTSTFTEGGKFVILSYCGASIHAVHEVGFSGFALHRELVKQGVDNIVVHATSIKIATNDRSCLLSM